MAEETWLTFDEAVELVQQLYGTTIGHAQKLVKDARKSGEVRHEPPPEPFYLTMDDGLVGFDQTPGAVADPDHKWVRRRSKDDLADWLRRTLGDTTPAAQKGRRYAGDDELVAEGVEGIRKGTWPNAHQAAQDLAPRAQGSSEAAKVDRLSRKISDRLHPETSQKSS